MDFTRRRKIRKLFPVIAAIFALNLLCEMAILAAHAFAETEKVFLTAFDYPPYMDESLPEGGLFCELVREAYRAVGYEALFQFYPLKRSTRYVIDGEVLAQLGTEWNFPENARKNDVESIPLFYYRVVGFYLKDRFSAISFKTLKDLKDYSLGVISGSSDSAILKRGPDLDVEEVTTMEQMFQKVYTARNDIGFAVELSGLTFIAAHYPNEQARWAMTEDGIQGILAQVVFSKKYPENETYINAFREGIQRIRENGTYLMIFEKYYGEGKVPGIVSDITKKIYVIPQE